MMNNSSVLEIHDLTVNRGKSAVLRGITCTLPTGRIVGLLGPSGSGKSTLMRAIAGSQIITSGTVNVLGEPAGSRALRHRIGYMTQAASVYDDLSVRQNVRYFARILKLEDAEVERVLNATDLAGQANSRVSDLSGGQRNRVSLAVALLGSPDLVILDEPTVGLDPVLRSQLWHIFAELAETGMCLLVSSHVMDEAMRCHDLLLLREGQLLGQMSPQQLLETTGATDPERAFLELIDRQVPSTVAPTAPSGGRHRRARRGERGDRP